MARSYRDQYAQYNRYFKTLVHVYETRQEVRIGIELLLTFLTISFFGLFAIRPTVNTIAGLFAETQTQREISRQLTEKIDNLKKAQALYSQESSRLALIDQALPKGPQPEFLIRQLESLAAEHNLLLESLSVSKTPVQGKADPKEKVTSTTSDFEMSFLLKGSYENSVAFLEDVEKLRRLLLITSMNFGPSRRQGEEGVIILNIATEVPFYPNTVVENAKK